jgi:hypothetical protein
MAGEGGMLDLVSGLFEASISLDVELNCRGNDE